MEFLEKKNLRIAATEEIFRRKPDEWDEYSHSLRNKHQTTVVMGLLIMSYLKNYISRKTAKKTRIVGSLVK